VVFVVDGNLGVQGDYAFVVEPFEGCVVEALPSETDLTITGTTEGGTYFHTGTCAPSSESPEVAFSWVPPVDGVYRIETSGSSYDTVLYVRADECLGPELACNDDWQDLQSQVELGLVGGQPVVIFVDGFGGDLGEYRLRISLL
jgi:hypothetical protein